MSVKKRFDPELYAANDRKAKDAVIAELKSLGLEIKEAAKRTAVDLEVFKDGKHVLNIECEVKRAFGDKFKYDTLQIPYRKKKYAELDKKTVFVVFNKDCSNYMTVDSDTLINSPVAVVPNLYVPAGEQFFTVPIANVSFGNLVTIVDKLTN